MGKQPKSPLFMHSILFIYFHALSFMNCLLYRYYLYHRKLDKLVNFNVQTVTYTYIYKTLTKWSTVITGLPYMCQQSTCYLVRKTIYYSIIVFVSKQKIKINNRFPGATNINVLPATHKDNRSTLIRQQ